MGVYESFKKLLERIEPRQGELDRAGGHAGTVKTRLESSFDLKDFKIVGSHSRDTAIRTHSDADYFAVFSRDEFRWGDSYKSSNTVIDNIRQDLAARFWQTEVYKDGPAVVLGFGQGDYKVDVVPAIFWEIDQNKRPIYYMPNGIGGWMKTSPDSHNRFIKEANDRSRGQLRYTVQLVKFWRECRTPRTPISSFHLDLLLAAERICEGAKTYSQCLTETFQLLTRRECRAYLDPLGISGYVEGVKMGAQREAAYRSVAYAYEHAAKAQDAELRGNTSEAMRQWDIVFNGNFPY
jgi:hypothetical protein